MNDLHQGGPAFPTSPGGARDTSGNLDPDFYHGMTLRDYFASAIVQGWISLMPDGKEFDEKEIAEGSYTIADAMIEARKK